MKISEEIIKILSKCRIEENTVYLPATQLDRKTYMAVNKHLENLGGKWNRKAKGHVFDSDPTDSFDNMLLTGETTDFKKEFQFFETPKKLVDKMVEMIEIGLGDVILEPSAGRGAILDGIVRVGAEMVTDGFAVELNRDNCNVLKQKGYPVHNDDFLSIKGQFHFSQDGIDKIIMNPPFTRQQDIDHILHAWSLLNPGGILVSIVSESPFFRENKKSVEFRQFLEDNNAEIIKNPEGTFKASGTMVHTRLIKIRK